MLLCFLFFSTAATKEELPPHRLFTFSAVTGEEIHGIMYHPKDPVEGKKYPTIVYVYGGPRFQVLLLLLLLLFIWPA